MRRRGFTLIETLLVIVIMGVVVAAALPRIQRASVKQSLRGSRNTIVGLYAQTRMTAMQRGQPAALYLEGNRAFILSGGDTVGAPRNLNSEFGVTLTSDQSPIVVNAKGFIQAAGEIKVKTTKNGYADSVLIGWYGRLRK